MSSKKTKAQLEAENNAVLKALEAMQGNMNTMAERLEAFEELKAQPVATTPAPKVKAEPTMPTKVGSWDDPEEQDRLPAEFVRLIIRAVTEVESGKAEHFQNEWGGYYVCSFKVFEEPGKKLEGVGRISMSRDKKDSGWNVKLLGIKNVYVKDATRRMSVFFK